MNYEHRSFTIGRLLQGQKNIIFNKTSSGATEEEQCLYVLSLFMNLQDPITKIETILNHCHPYAVHNEALLARKSVSFSLSTKEIESSDRLLVNGFVPSPETEDQLWAIFNYFDSKINLASIAQITEVKRWVSEWKLRKARDYEMLQYVLTRKYEDLTDVVPAFLEQPAITLVLTPFIKLHWTDNFPKTFSISSLGIYGS